MTNNQYIMIDKQVTPCHDLMIWANWMENNPEKRRVAEDVINGVRISTVFLGLDHNFGRIGGPIVFETMVFGGMLDQEMNRYCTYERAIEGHHSMVRQVKSFGALNYLSNLQRNIMKIIGRIYGK